MYTRNRLMLELMARAGMRIGEVLKLVLGDMDGQRLILQSPKSGREGEIVYLPKKLADRLHQYTLYLEIQLSQRIFPNYLCCCLVHCEESRGTNRFKIEPP